MVTKILESIIGLGVPTMQVVLKLLPLLYQFKILKTEAEVREWTRRYQEAIKQAEASAKDPVNAKKQGENSEKDAEDKWNKEFGKK